MPKSLRKQKVRMWRENPKCRKCGVITVLPQDLEGFIQPDGVKKKIKTPDNLATIQHYYCKNHPLRLLPTNGKLRNVLWCFRCNNDKSKEESKKYPGIKNK